MSMRRGLRVGIVLAALVFGCAAHANLPQRHVLDASINLGWVTETLVREGRTAENHADLARGMAFAEAHVRALVGVTTAPYTELDFSAVLERLGGWDPATALSGAALAAQFVQQVHDRLRETVAVSYDAHAQRWVRGGSCDARFAEVGFHFGRAHVAALHGDLFVRGHQLWILRSAIQAGLRQDAEKRCGFGAQADWDRLPALAGDTSPEGFATTLTYLQEIALRAQAGRATAILPPAGGDAAPLGSNAENPALSCRHVLEAGASTGDGVYWLDPAGVDPFPAYCDMTRDDGGWTLYAIGADLPPGAEQPSITDPRGPMPQVLRQDRAWALAAVSSGLFRISDLGQAQSFYIRDTAPLFASGQIGGFGRGHVWATSADAVACATDYAQVRGAAMDVTGTFAIDCESRGPGSHACGTVNGWILLHGGGTYDHDGQHPCSFGPGQSLGLVMRWVR